MNPKQIDPRTINPNDKEAIKKFISSISEDKLKNVQDIFTYFLPIWADNKIKERKLNDLVDEDKKYIFQTLLLISCTRGRTNKFCAGDIEKTADGISDDVGRETIEDIITSIKNGDDREIEKLICEFKRRATGVRDSFVKEIKDYKFKHLPKKKKEQVEHLQRNADKEDKVSTIIASYYRNDEKVKILDDALKNFDWLVKTIDLSVFTSKALKINESQMGLIAELVSDPSCLIPQDAVNVLKEVDVPNTWYTHSSLTVSEYRNYCENITDPDEWRNLINRICKRILRKIDVPIMSIQARKKIITEIIDSIHDRRFEVSFLSIYIEIEGLLWDFAFEINKNEDIFDKNDETGKSLIDVETGNSFKSDRIRDVIERTAMKNFIDSKFIKDFCEEIYEERNLILHGRLNCFSGCHNDVFCITQKLMSIDYILDLLIAEFQKNLFKQLDSMQPDVIERIVDSYDNMVNGEIIDTEKEN